MKFSRYDGGKTAMIVGSGGPKIMDVPASAAALRVSEPRASAAILEALTSDGSWVGMIGDWDRLRPSFQALESAATRGSTGIVLHDYDAARLGPPLAAPSVHIFGAGSNTTVHVQHAFKVMQNLDLSLDDVMKPKRDGIPPGGFTVWPDLVIGPESTVVPPRRYRKLDYEAECAVYVKQGGRDLETVQIWGHTAWNDFGVRDPHLGLAAESPWIPFSFNLPKNFDGANACGPWVVVDEGHDLANLRCRCLVNGDVRQDWNTSKMIYDFNDLLSYISTYQLLRPGDMMTSGTGAGVALEGGVDGALWLKPGDRVDVEVEGVATLTNAIGDW